MSLLNTVHDAGLYKDHIVPLYLHVCPRSRMCNAPQYLVEASNTQAKLVRVEGFEPSISCSQSRRIKPDFPTLGKQY